MPGYPSSAAFLGANPVFSRAEFAQAVGRQPGQRAITELLKYHLRAGNIRRISRGVFASVPKAAVPISSAVDRYLAASRVRMDAVVAYRSALELHGCATSNTNEVQLIARGAPGVIEMADFSCRFITPPRHHSSPDGLTIVERQGLAVNVTTLEQTLVDLFDRYDLAGTADDLFRSLDLIPERPMPLEIDALVRFAKRLRNAAAAGALGFWLDRERHPLNVTAEALEGLRSLAPRHARYALGATPGRGRAATGWNVILPTHFVERYFDD